MENSIFEKLRRLLSVILAVVTGLLVAMAIARPEIEFLTGKTGQTIIVMDTSPTMLSRTADGRTRWQHAVDSAQGLLDQGSGNTQFRIADTTGQFGTSFTTDRTELKRVLEEMHPVISPTRFPDIDKQAAEGSEASEVTTQVYFVTDGVSSLRAPEGTVSLSVFEAAANIGITAFEIRSMPSSQLSYQAFLELYNSGKDAKSVEMTVSGAGQQRITKTVRIARGESYREALDLSKFDGGGIRAAIRSDGDALSADDVAYAYLPVKRRTKTQLVTRGNRLLETVLKVDRLIELSVTDPSGYTGGGDFDAFVFDRFAPAEPPSRPALIIGAQNVPWLRRSTGTAGKPAFESWAEDHPVMQYVSLHDVSVDSAAKIDSANLTVLAAAQNGAVPLIVASEQPRWIMLTFDLQSSDLPYHTAFPIFIDNALAWFDREKLALRRSPGVVEIPIAGAQIRTVDGQPVPSRANLEGTVFEALEPGLYVAGKADVRQYIAVNFANRQYSDINDSRVKGGKAAQAEMPLLSRELWFYMLCAATLLIAGEWFTYHRRITL